MLPSPIILLWLLQENSTTNINQLATQTAACHRSGERRPWRGTMGPGLCVSLRSGSRRVVFSNLDSRYSQHSLFLSSIINGHVITISSIEIGTLVRKYPNCCLLFANQTAHRWKWCVRISGGGTKFLACLLLCVKALDQLSTRRRHSQVPFKILWISKYIDVQVREL